MLPPPPPTVREVTRWITSHPGHLTDDETAQLGQVKARSIQLSAAAGHVTAFAEMMARRHGEHLPGWLAAVDLDDLSHLHSFARGIRRDQAAVTNGLTLDHSSGPSKATSAASRHSNARCSAAPTSTCYEKGSCSADNSTQSHQFTEFVPEPLPSRRRPW